MISNFSRVVEILLVPIYLVNYSTKTQQVDWGTVVDVVFPTKTFFKSLCQNPLLLGLKSAAPHHTFLYFGTVIGGKAGRIFSKITCESNFLAKQSNWRTWPFSEFFDDVARRQP